MHVSSARTLVRGSLAAASLALLVAGFSVHNASAQDAEMTGQGPIVTLAGTGSDINAAGANVTISGDADDIRAAGARVTVTAKAAGDVWAAGAEVTLSGSANDVRAAGAIVSVAGTASGDVDVAGAVVRTNTTVGGNVRIGGANVVVGSFSDITRDLKAAGANLRIGGHIGGEVKAGGAVVVFDGVADGPVTIAGFSVTIGANARIGGDLTVISANAPTVETGAVISGTTRHALPPESWTKTPLVWTLAFAVAAVLGTILTGLVLMLFGGRVFSTATEHVRHRPLSSFLFGILTVVLVPFVAVILMATVVGITAGVAVMLLLPFLIVFGHAVAAAGIAGGILIRRRGDVGAALGFVMLLVGALVLVALGFIPIVGPIIVCIALLLGVGAFTRTVGHRLRRAEPRLPI